VRACALPECRSSDVVDGSAGRIGPLRAKRVFHCLSTLWQSLLETFIKGCEATKVAIESSAFGAMFFRVLGGASKHSPHKVG
jgi:hypothetical protein